jgi:protein-arginine kinase activator protein McsA
MFKEAKMIYAVCDGCSKPLEDSDGQTQHFPTVAVAQEKLAEHKWQSLSAGRLRCPDCTKAFRDQVIANAVEA